MSNITDFRGEYPQVFKKVDPSDMKFNPMELHKTFSILSGSAVDDGFLPLQAIYISTVPAISGSEPFNDAKNVDGSYKFNIYNSIYHLFYKNKTHPDKVFGKLDLNNASRFFYKSASIFSIPQKQFGNKIQPGTFEYTGSTNLASDRYGNIYDVAVVTSSFPSDVKFYEGFNEYFDTSRIKFYNTPDPQPLDTSSFWQGFWENVTYGSGVPTSDGSQLPIGLSAHFNQSGSISTSLDGFYDRDHNYAISFYISSSNTTTENQLILGKLIAPLDVQTQLLAAGIFDDPGMFDLQYPFLVELSGSNELIYSISGGTGNIVSITSSADVSSSWNHVVCQKTGSEMQLYLNATLHSTASSNMLIPPNTSATASIQINNGDPLKIGGYWPGRNFSFYDMFDCLQGDLDEIRIYNKALTTAEIATLADRTEGGGMLQTNRVGNVFHDHGFAVISSPDYRYDNIITTNYTASYKSTITHYELSSLCRTNAGDFGLTLNPSALKDDNETYLNMITGSDFNPYITTIGLYNQNAQLIAIGKFASAIKKRDDIDMNIHVRIDLDNRNYSEAPQ